MATEQCIISGKQVTYHEVLDKSFDGWAQTCGWEAAALRAATVFAIRGRHYQAVIEHEADRARGRRPNIWTLDLGGVRVIYTVEPHAVVIRDYKWVIAHPPRDDFDGGGCYTEYDWLCSCRTARRQGHSSYLAPPFFST